jgi:hypothetical protein
MINVCIGKIKNVYFKKVVPSTGFVVAPTAAGVGIVGWTVAACSPPGDDASSAIALLD